MADSKITALTSISTSSDPANDPLVIVDVSDTSMAATGTTKKVTLNQLLATSPTATLASATITGDLTVRTNKLAVTSTGVGCGVAIPLVPLHAETAGTGTTAFSNFVATFRSQAAGRDATLQFSDGTNQAAISMLSGALSFGTGGTNTRYQIDGTGISTWSVGGTTAMTLNATGLGVGTGPTHQLTVRSSAAAIGMFHSTNASGPYIIFQNSTANFGDIGSELGITGGGSAGNLTLNSRSTSNLCFAVNDSVRMRIDSSGNVGIGVTPSAKIHSKAGAVTLGGIIETGGASSLLSFADAGTSSYTRVQIGSVGNNLVGIINGTQAMTLDASGNLLVGATAQVAAEKFHVNQTVTNAWSVTMRSVTRGWLNRQSDANGGIAALFEVGASNTNVGSITTTASATSYTSASDYRLKEAVQPLVGGLSRLSALKPSIYKWKVDGSSGEGFLAHELADVVPLAVTGEKDAVDADGKPTYQGVDLSKVVPILVAAIQELTARVQTLEAK